MLRHSRLFYAASIRLDRILFCESVENHRSGNRKPLVVVGAYPHSPDGVEACSKGLNCVLLASFCVWLLPEAEMSLDRNNKLWLTASSLQNSSGSSKGSEGSRGIRGDADTKLFFFSDVVPIQELVLRIRSHETEVYRCAWYGCPAFSLCA